MILHADQLNFAYKNAGKQAVKDFVYDFYPGRFYGIFGPNGSGKSTLLKLLSLDIAGTGQVRIDEADLQTCSIRERAKLMAVESGSSEMDLPFTVKEYVKLGAYIWDKMPASPGKTENVEQILAEWDLTHLADKFVSRLSSGERQRVKLARVWAQNSTFILLDEPGSHLDWSVQLDLYRKLRELCREENKCVIMVCHDLWLAPFYLDEALLLKDGQLITSGAPSAALSADNLNIAFGSTLDCQRDEFELRLKSPRRG